jgi:uncharacterized protein (TIGR02466 family)
MNIQNLFPTPVGCFALDRELTKAEKDFCINQKRRPNMGNTTSTDTEILDRPKMKKIKGFIENCVDQYFKEVYRPNTNVSLRFTQSWLNYTEQGDFHHKHSHANSFLSGVFYIDATPDCDKIFFYKEEYSSIEVTTEDWNMWNSRSWWFPVATGALVLFPSSLVHMVEAVDHQYTRISLAFNTYLQGNIGSKDNLTHLSL